MDLWEKTLRMHSTARNYVNKGTRTKSLQIGKKKANRKTGKECTEAIHKKRQLRAIHEVTIRLTSSQANADSFIVLSRIARV